MVLFSKFRVDTAENGPVKVEKVQFSKHHFSRLSANFSILSSFTVRTRRDLAPGSENFPKIYLKMTNFFFKNAKKNNFNENSLISLMKLNSKCFKKWHKILKKPAFRRWLRPPLFMFSQHAGLRKWTRPVSKSTISHANWHRVARKWLIYYWNFATSP